MRLTALLFGIALALVLGEGVVRLVAPQKLVKPCLLPDNALGHRYRAHCCFLDDWHPEWFTYEVCTNDLGLRMPVDVAADPSRPRWLWLGDSFTFGWGVEQPQSWLGLLDSLAAASGCRLQMVNGGHPGWGTSQQIVFLERMLARVRPARVWYVFHETDPFDNMGATAVFGFRQNGDTLQLYRRPARTGMLAWLNEQPWYLWLQQRSHLFVLLKQTLTGRIARPRRPRAYAALPALPEVDRLTSRVTLAEIDSLIAICRKADLPFGLVWLPSMQELPLDFPDDWQAAWSLVAFKDTLRAHLARRQVPFADLTPAFRQKVNKHTREALYFPEAHFRPLGHRLLFESMMHTPPLDSLLARCEGHDQ